MLARTARLHPARPAIQTTDQTLTYAELAVAARRLADRLAALGIGPGDRVGIQVTSGTASLYLAIAGVLAAGAAYVPVDADEPPARAAACWDGASVCAIVGNGLDVCSRRPDDGLDVSSRRPGTGAGRALDPSDDAWVIFTSGSTGRPKGVAVSHRAATAFVAAEARLWSVGPHDRVLAGLSVAFDASCEEIWLAWANGATLLPVARTIVRSGGDLGPWIAERRVTVVSTVPTLAALWDETVLSGVRLLILGGETLPNELAWRLACGRDVWNTYGPTEATVVSTAARVRVGEPVAIGWPLSGWIVAVVADDGTPVPFGEPGELLIAGIGLGRYLDPALDAGRFAPNAALGLERAYRTGDIVRETLAGLHFVGRRDDQIKLGGRRLELGEVEAQLAGAPGVTAAAAALRATTAGNPVLVGYVTGPIDAGAVRDHLRQHLPPGVAPLIVELDDLPKRTSGKVDRSALPWPPPTRQSGSLAGTRAWLADHWADQLGPVPVDPGSDFFALGGSSVAVAKLISALRHRFPTVAVADVYRHRTLAALADRLDELGELGSVMPAPPTRPAGRWAAAQIASVLCLIAFTAPAWLIAAFAFDDWQGFGPRIAWPWLVIAWAVLISPPARMLTAIAAKALLLGRLEPGRHPRRGWLATRVLFLDRLGHVLHVERGAGTPWAPRVARLIGAEIGPGARLATLPPLTSLVRVGAGATIEPGVDLHGWWIDGDDLVVGELRIGAGARVGARTVLMPGAEIGAGAEIEPGSVVSTPVPPGQRWAGSPARHVGPAGERWPDRQPTAAAHPRLWRAMFAVGTLGLNLIGLVATVPALLAFQAISRPIHSPSSALAALLVGSPLLAAAFVVGDALVVALAFRAAARLIRPGWHADTGGAAWALWFTGQLAEGSATALFPLYATIYTRAWLRLHGLRVGRRTEVSTTEGLNPLVSLGHTCFVADHPLFAGARAHRGWLHLDPITIGNRSFIGNGALVGAGSTVGDDCLIGIESNAPRDTPDGTSWFGAPALELPRMAEPTHPGRTVDPPRRLVLARGATEIVRILLPTTVNVILATLVLQVILAIDATAGLATAVTTLPLVLAAAAAAAVLVTVAMKWLIIGRYRPGEAPLFSSLVWRDEIINSCQEQLAGEWIMEKALGTPLVPAYLRLMGAKVGRDVWCETLAITEFDVVTIDDGCAINRGACIETHLFHDRVLRIGPTEMGAGSTLGPTSAILPDTKLGAGCVVGGRSVVLRGEELPPGTNWHGSPVIPA
ncbi:MAG TPA: Pls/PosA family non-ribosomal peptide synthetase [Solirubrobacteraceae bacterium]|nr:Pls/PosA family non-ribosomal peptide synthetase [Solirubrobacteraceae bacterium]